MAKNIEVTLPTTVRFHVFQEMGVGQYIRGPKVEHKVVEEKLFLIVGMIVIRY